MNENTWRHVMAWEQMHCAECKSPQLLRFCGRPDELRRAFCFNLPYFACQGSLAPFCPAMCNRCFLCPVS